MSEAPVAEIPTWRNRIQRRRQEVVAWLLTDRSVGGESVPNSWASLKIRSNPNVYPGTSRYNIGFADDAHMIQAWAGFEGSDPEDDPSVLYLPATVFRRMAIWYLWRWTVGEWFGLRRWLFYMRLSRNVRKHTRQTA